MSARDESFRAALRGEVIFTDDQGHPFEPPAQEPDEPAWLFERRYQEWRDKITDRANAAFDQQLRKELSKT
jgi:hypothetical protein